MSTTQPQAADPRNPLASNDAAGVGSRIALVAVIAVLCGQYYLFDVMSQVYSMPTNVVKLPPKGAVG